MSGKNHIVMAYLQASGIFDRPHTAEDITALKKQYWAQYRANWRKEKRLSNHEYTVYFSQKENAAILRAAAAYDKSPTRFIQEAALSKSTQHRIVPNEELFGDIRGSLTIIEMMIETMGAEDKVSNANQERMIQELLSIQQQITSLFHDPVLLERVVRDAIDQNPNYRTTLVKLLNSTSHGATDHLP